MAKEARVGGECTCYYALGDTTPPFNGTSGLLEHITDLSVSNTREEIDTSTRSTYPTKTSKPAGTTIEVTFTLMNWQDSETQALATDVAAILDAFHNTKLITFNIMDGPGGNGQKITGYIVEDSESQGLSEPNTHALKLTSAAKAVRILQGALITAL